MMVEGDEHLDPSDLRLLTERGIAVPAELAQRWKAVRDAWYNLGKEIANYLQGTS